MIFLSALDRDDDRKYRAQTGEGRLGTILLGKEPQGPRSGCEKEDWSPGWVAVRNGSVGSGPSKGEKRKSGNHRQMWPTVLFSMS